MRTKAFPNAGDKGQSFEREVRELLALMGYLIKANELIQGTQIDLVAERPSRLENIRFIVECTDRADPVGVPLVKEKSSVLLSIASDSHIHKLLFVSKSGFTAEAKAFAKGNAAIELLTLDDLQGLLIDFSPYARWYLSHFDSSDSIFAEGLLADRYVELNCNSADDESSRPLSVVAREWLNDEDNNLLFLLGEFGSGKTSFCRRFAYDLLDERYRRGQPQRFIPILINLRENRRAFDLPRILVETLSNRYGVHLSSFQAFEHYCSKRHICLLLDGLDEMVDRSDRRTVAECLEQVFLLASLNAKTILTCRTNFFNCNADIVSGLQKFSIAIGSREKESELIEIAYRKHGRVLHVTPLDESQIREFISKRSDDPDKVIASIRRIHDLSDLSRRPVLLDMILTTLPHLMTQSKAVNSAALYAHYTNRWTARDEWRVSMPLPARQSFCEALAWTMHTSNIEEVGYSELEAAMNAALKGVARSEGDLERFKNDLKTCSFLTRVGTGDRFRFAHKSFLEFFVARKLARVFEGAETIAQVKGGDGTKKATRKGAIDKWRTMKGSESHVNTSTLLVRRPVVAPDLDWAAFYESFRAAFSLSRDFVIADEWFSSQMLGRTTRLRGNRTVQTELELQMERVLGLRGTQSSQFDVSLTEEIATFVLESLDNFGVPLEKILANAESEALQMLLADILRLSKFKEYVRRQATFITSYIKECQAPTIQVSMAAALARSAETVDKEFVASLRSLISEDGFTYVLFELAARRDNAAASAFELVLSLPDVRSLDRVICRHGLDKTLPEAERSLITLGLVEALLKAEGDAEFQLGVSLTNSMSFESAGGFETLKSAFRRAKDTSTRLKIVAALRRTSGEPAWRGIRMLAASERDERTRSELFKAEEEVRSKHSAASARSGWSSNCADARLRAAFWKALRSKSKVS